LHPKAPMYITVDAPKKEIEGQTWLETLKRLDAYTEALYYRFRGAEFDHVTIVVNPHHQHINGSIHKVLRSLLDASKTKYIYVLQHDLRFVNEEKTIDHRALVDAFDEYSPKNIIRKVGFNQSRNSKQRNGRGVCKGWLDSFNMSDPWLIANRTNKYWEDTPTYDQDPIADDDINSGRNRSKVAPPTPKNEIYLSYVSWWSDNNHFTTVDYYEELLHDMGPVPRAPENPMYKFTVNNCTYWGTHLYGDLHDGNYICHLDGRELNDLRYNNCPLVDGLEGGEEKAT